MTELKPNYETRKQGRGRPRNGKYPHKIFARVPPEMRRHIDKTGLSDSEYIRYLITADMLRTPPNRED